MKLSRSTRFEIVRRLLAAVADHFIFDHLTLVEGAQVGPLDRGDTDEYISAAVLGLNETVALRRVEPFHGASLSARTTSRPHDHRATVHPKSALPMERLTAGCATNKAKLEHRDCTRFSQGVQPRHVIENKRSNPLDNRTDKAQSHTITGHNAQQYRRRWQRDGDQIRGCIQSKAVNLERYDAALLLEMMACLGCSYQNVRAD